MKTEFRPSTAAKADIYLPPLPEILPVSTATSLPQDLTQPLTDLSPVPTPIPRPWPWPPPPVFRVLRAGCYLINYQPKDSGFFVTYDGTLRVEARGFERTASGDLYQRPSTLNCIPGPYGPICWPVLLPGPTPASGIPILARNQYRYYLRVTEILELITAADNFNLGFQMYRFDLTKKTWTNEGDYTAQMFWMSAPPGYPSSTDYLEGDVTNAAGTIVGRLTMGWVSESLRKATVEIDRVSQSEAPLNNGAGVDWGTIFNQTGWDVTVLESNDNVPEASGASWNEGECHAAMLNHREKVVNLDREWHYHLLCVRRLDPGPWGEPLGVMYDSYGSDSNNIPREGAALGSHFVFPNESRYGLCKGMRFGACTAPYFRSAVHEIGHAMLMFHPSDAGSTHIMQQTGQVISNATEAVPFPNNITWSFSASDQRLLRHLPDMAVRPGGSIKFEEAWPNYPGIPISPEDSIVKATGLELKVDALLDTVPLGAPVRANLTLVNMTKEPLPVPSSLSMKTGYITGKVIDQSGITRTFSTIVRNLDEMDLQILQPGQSLSHSLTVVRGAEGALFPSSGIYRLQVNVIWDVNGYSLGVSDETAVMVTPPVDEAHAKAAMKVLSTPDTLLTLVLGGDHLKDGVEAIQGALNNPVLRPHFAYIEAKRLAQRFGKRKADLSAAAQLIDDVTVMSPAEIKKAAMLVKSNDADSAAKEPLAKTLKGKIKGIDISDEIKDMVDSL